ncbi:MAG: preprotein translocase subunit SecE [Oscillospiraceae bacterium]|jgi:preprotein translocase subunit SecE|nr:preprotein translocase subunit SecE [Oscillospiraceae bacterium]
MSQDNGTNGKDNKGLTAKGAPVKAAHDKKPVGAKAKPNGWQRFTNGLAAIPKRIKKSVLNTVAELKKVTWPTKQALISYSLVVIVFMVLLAIVVGVLDLGASALVKLIIRV